MILVHDGSRPELYRGDDDDDDDDDDYDAFSSFAKTCEVVLESDHPSSHDV